MPIRIFDILRDEFRPFQEKLYAALGAKEMLIAPAVVFKETLSECIREIENGKVSSAEEIL